MEDHETERYARTVAARADRVLTTSRWLKAELGVAGIPTEVWHPGVDPAAFSPALRDQRLHQRWSRGDAIVVGHLGPLERRRDVHRLSEAASVTGCRWVIVGDGPEKRRLHREIPGAIWLPTLGTGDWASVVASLDLIVQPSLRESSCHTLRQAAASGVAAIAPASGGVPDVVRHSETGLLYDPLFGLDLRQTLGQLAADPERRQVMGRAARARSLRRTWVDAVDELIGVHYAAALRRLPLAA